MRDNGIFLQKKSFYALFYTVNTRFPAVFFSFLINNEYICSKINNIEEANRYFFFIRPRRFGKSLLLNMLRQYYDVNKRDLFDRLFGDLWIGQHPTEMRNQYLVLYLDFSMISGGLQDYQESMATVGAHHRGRLCRHLPATTAQHLPRH